MRDATDLREGDIVAHEGRIWRITKKEVMVRIEMKELAEDDAPPLARWLEGRPDDAIFSPEEVCRLVPEMVPTNVRPPVPQWHETH